MAYPLIILGAGASFDYLQDNQEINEKREYNEESFKISDFKPPLTNDLFRKEFNQIISEFREMGSLPGRIVSAVVNGEGLEKYLFDLEKQGIFKKEFVAIRFYLHKLFQVISGVYGNRSTSNLHGLVTEIKRNFDDGCCIVDFNYDLLLEQALDLEQVLDVDNSLARYIKDSIKVIKPHGSCNWVHCLLSPYDDEDKDKKNSYDYFLSNPDKIASTMHEKRGIYVDNDCLTNNYIKKDRGSTYFLSPALFFPGQNKENFICPQTHINELEKALKLIDRILIIGWRAQDDMLINLMKKHIHNSVSLTIVSGDDKEVKFVQERLEGIPISRQSSCIEFSKFVGSPSCDDFFQKDPTETRR